MQKKFLISLATIICLLSCQKNTENNQNVSYRLKWLYNTSAAGSLFAKDMGYYSDNNLNVTIKQGGVEKNPIAELELERAQFGVASADQVIRAISSGSPIVVIAQLFQQSPMNWIYRSNKISIKSPQDLKGKTIGITYGNEDETIMKALLRKYNIDQKHVKFFSVKYDYTPFYTGKVDLWPVYKNSNGIIIKDKMEQSSEQIKFFNPFDFGINFVANSIITTKNIVDNNKDLVEKFSQSLIKGWENALKNENIEKTIKIIKKYDKTTDNQIIKKQILITKSLIIPDKNIKTGSINKPAWIQTENILLKQGIIPEKIGISKYLIDIINNN